MCAHRRLVKPQFDGMPLWTRMVRCLDCGVLWRTVQEALAAGALTRDAEDVQATRVEPPVSWRVSASASDAQRAAMRGALARGIAEGLRARMDPSKCDHDVTCGKCGTRWPSVAPGWQALLEAAEREAAAIRAALEDTVE